MVDFAKINSFNEQMDKMIEDVKNDVSIERNVRLLEDLKRMGGLGVLTIYEGPVKTEGVPPEPLTMTQVYGLKFTGEEEISRLRSQLDQMRSTLVNYMKDVVQSEGVSFVDSCGNCTGDQIDLLKEIEKELDL